MTESTFNTSAVRIRPFTATDSIEELTILINTAYSSFLKLGIPVDGATQSVERTRQRVSSGLCLVAEYNHRLVGTLLVRQPFTSGVCSHFLRKDVSVFQQLAIDPTLQRQGVAQLLIDSAEAAARAFGLRHAAFDTPAAATELLEYYYRKGYSPIDTIRWPGSGYDSVVCIKALTSSSAA